MAPGPELATVSLDSEPSSSWEPLRPAQVAAISNCCIAHAGWPRGQTKVGADLGLHHLGNPRACAPSGQLQTTLEHHHPAPTWLILHRGLRLVVSGHSQCLQLTGLGKSLPLMCQQQPRLSCKRRVYSAHTKGTPQVLSLGDRGGCAAGLCRTPTALGHTTKAGSHSIHRNKHREAAKMKRQRNTA